MKKSVITPKGTHPPVALYSHAFKAEGKKLLFVSGQVPIDSSGNLVGPGDLRAQVKQSLENMKAVLEEAGANFSNIVNTNTYLRNFEDVQKYWAIRKELFPQYFTDGVYPPSTLMVVTSMYREDVLFEFEAVALTD